MWPCETKRNVNFILKINVGLYFRPLQWSCGEAYGLRSGFVPHYFNHWYSSCYPATHLAIQGLGLKWLARCLSTVTGWDTDFGMQPLLLCGSTSNCLSWSALRYMLHVSGTNNCTPARMTKWLTNRKYETLLVIVTIFICMLLSAILKSLLNL